ncbi:MULTISPECIES: glycosyltransferase [unclassified Synechocystis]|uniref:glycosyltransferase n=1 Tax=unclassified Synechocystis TaxID=2640012 RepID=UPI00048D497F|nr:MULTISPECIES: glycosyltransferase [unclassified Synechocystis]AIE74664.1 Glycosyltransferase [Synechocystis sp. PCC 6714]MCT0253980.1 glycosyltransferase [Synechocystis sp. CS-94]
MKNKQLLEKLSNPSKLFKAIWWRIFGRVIENHKIYKKQLEQKYKIYPVVSGIGDLSSCSQRALLSYIVTPFLDGFTEEIYRTHTNYQKTQEIVEILNAMGFIVDVTDWRNFYPPSISDYDLIIGQYFGFVQSCISSPYRKIPKIYLGTGCYAGFIKKALALREEEIRRRRNFIIPQSYIDDEGPKLATDIFFVGNSTTHRSYKEITSAKVLQLCNPVVKGIKNTLDNKDFAASRFCFMWMAAYGTVRRSLDVLLEIFAEHSEFELWVCGGIEHEKAFFNAYRHELLDLPNIHYVGWLDVAGEKYRQITSKCGFMLYPSVSDGMPGSVVNAMYAGVVPIVTPEAGMDCGGYGFEIPKIDHETIYQIVCKASSMSPEELENESHAVHEFTSQRYSPNAFKESFAEALEKTLKRHGLL